MKKFFKRNKKDVGNAKIKKSSDSTSTTIPSNDSNLTVSSRGSVVSSTNSLNESPSYLYPNIKEKHLKDIFKAVWSEDYLKTKNILAKSKNKANLVDNENRTPLHFACAKGNQPILQELLLCHPKVDTVDKDGSTPLIKAVQSQSDLCAGLLLSMKPDIDIKDKSGYGALHYATMMGWEEGVRALLEAKADVTLPDSSGNTALHLACLGYVSSREIANILLTFRAPVNLQNNRKETPLIISADKGDERLVYLLVEGGHADLTLKVEEGWTALDKAQMNGFHAIVEYLQNKEDEMRRSVEASVLTRRTLEEVTEEGGEEEESANDVISIMEEQTNPDSDDNDVDNSDAHFHADNAPAVESIPAPPDDPPPWTSSDEDEKLQVQHPTNGAAGKLTPPKREMNSDSISLLLPAATDDQQTDTQLNADSKQHKFSLKATGGTAVADVGDDDLGKSFSDDDFSLGLGLPKNRPKTTEGSNRRQDAELKPNIDEDLDHEDGLKVTAKARSSRNILSWNHDQNSDIDEFAADRKPKADATDNASVTSWSLDEKTLSNGVKLSPKDSGPKSSYWDSSEEETEAQEQLEKLRLVASTLKQPETVRPGFESPSNQFDFDSDEGETDKDDKVGSSKESVRYFGDVIAGSSDVIGRNDDVRDGSVDVIAKKYSVRGSSDDIGNDTNRFIGSDHDTSEAEHDGRDNDPEKEKTSQHGLRGPSHLEEVKNKVDYESDDDNWDSDEGDDEKSPRLDSRKKNEMETEVHSGKIQVPILEESQNSSDLNVLDKSSGKFEDDKLNKLDSPFDSESESEKGQAANGVDSLKNRIDKKDQPEGLVAVMSSSIHNNSQVKAETSDGSDSNIDKNPISKKGKVSESSEEEREENGMMVNIIGARQTKASPEFVPKFGMNVNKNAERPTPPRKVVPDPVLTDEDSSQAEPTEPTSSWEIENRNKRMQKQLSVKADTEKEDEEIAVGDDGAVLEQMLHLNAAVGARNVDNSFEVSNTDFDDEGLDANDEADSTVRGVIYPSSGPESKVMAAGGGDRIPSTPVPSKNAGGPGKPSTNDAMKHNEDATIGQTGKMKKKGKLFDKDHKKKEEIEDDEDDSSDNLGPPTVSIGYSPRLTDITNNVSSLAGSVAIKNQFREQGRLIAQEQVEKQRMERKLKAFESDVDALSNKIQQLQKEKELTEEDEVRLKNDLKSLKQQLVDEQENRQLSEQVSVQKCNQVDKLESELERETVAKEDAERNCRQLQMQLKELDKKLKNIESLPATKLGSRRGSGSLGNTGSQPRNLLLLDETQAPEMEADDIINTVEEAVAVESVPTGLQAAPPPKEDHQAMIHQLPMNAPQIDFITMAEKVAIEEKYEKEMDEIKQKITEMETQLEDLQEEKNKITEDLAAENMSKQKLMIQLDAEKARSVNNQERADDKIRELKEKVEEKESFVKHLQGELRAKDEQISELQEKIHSREVHNTKLQADLDHTQQVVTAEKELLHQSNAERLKLQSEVKQQQESMNEMYQTSVDYKRDIALAEARLKANEDARRGNETEKEDLKNKIEKLRQQLENSMQKQSETEMKNSELSVKLSLLEREKEAEPEMEEKLSSLRDQLLESQKEQSRLTTELNSASMAKEFAVEKVANYERQLGDLKLEQAKLQEAFTSSLKETVTASLKAATVAAQERAHVEEEKSPSASSRSGKKSTMEDSKQDYRLMAPRERTRNVDQIIEEHRKQDLQSIPPVNWHNHDRYYAEETPIIMANPYNNALMAEKIPYKLDGIQNELDREKQHRLNAEIDNRQLKHEANQAYADQNSLSKRMEALEKRIDEHVLQGNTVAPSGGVLPVPGSVPTVPVGTATTPKVVYPSSGANGAVIFDASNCGIDLERFKKDIEAQCRMELIEQQQKVNSYLDEQINMRSNFEKARAEQENALKHEYNRRISDLELEIRKYKDLYGVTIPVRDPGVVVTSSMTSLGEDPEMKRLHTLLEKERRQREKLESRLDRMVDRDIESRAQIAVEKQRMSDLTSSGGLGSAIGLGSQSGHVSEFDALLQKVRRQLDNSISRHLGTTKTELEMFSQHPYATRDRSFYPTYSGNMASFNSSYKF